MAMNQNSKGACYLMYNKEYFKYQLLNADNSYVKELFQVEGCSINYASLSELKVKAQANITLLPHEALEPRQRIRIIHVLNDVETVIATLLVTTAAENYNSYSKTLRMELFSTLWFFKVKKTINRYYLTEGTNAVNEVKRLLSDVTGVAIEIEESTKTTTVPREWEVGTPYLQIANELLESINYTSLYVLPSGNISSRPYVLPENREVEHSLDGNNCEDQLEVEFVSELDYFDVPNIFVRYVNNPDTLELMAKYENLNTNSPTSTVNAPPNMDVQEVADAADVQTLMDIAKRDCSNATNKYHTIKFNTAIRPNHGYMDCIYLSIGNIKEKLIETEWSIDCQTGGQMQHFSRKVVII